MKRLLLQGPAFEQGRTHGAHFAQEIQSVLARWRAEISSEYDPDELIRSTVHDLGLLDVASQYAPNLVEEARGIATGCGEEFDTIVAWQLIDELWWNLDELTDAKRPMERCSALAINHNGAGFVAQTQDLNRYFDRSQTMLHYIDDDGLEILAPSCAGLLALNGVNSAGLAVGITTLSSLPHAANGLGSGFIVASLLRCRSVDEALDLLRNAPIASGNSFLLGSRDRSVIVEASAADVVVSDDGSRAIRTNHPLAQKPSKDYLRFAYSTERYAQLDETVRSDSTLDELIGMYRTGAICQSRAKPGDVVSIATMIFELAEQSVCHYAPGPLDDEEIFSFHFMNGAPT